MNPSETNHFQIQFERQNSKYNRLWSQLSAFAMFFIGTLFILFHYLLDSVGNDMKAQTAIFMIVFLSVFCGISGLVIWTEMERIKESIDGILDIFEELAFPKSP